MKVAASTIWRKIKNKNELFLTQLFAAPIVVCGNSLKAGCAVLIVLSLMVLVSTAVQQLFGNQIRRKLRAYVSIFVSCLVYAVSLPQLKKISPFIADLNKIYFPLLVLHSFALSNYSVFTRTGNANKPFSIKNNLFYISFFSIQILLISCLREWLGSGTIWDVSFPSPKLKGFLAPFGGFVIMGCFLGLINKLTDYEDAEE
ncbi:MAG: hypothetical protein LBJ83_00920 [Oscillospiraceae bacterium]|jgi:Na+-translocating ferredoxin:NAD+ oxidoreductase RnfE subunit|nr:hypothetical protein [Oscillospiraceae bacterium]